MVSSPDETRIAQLQQLLEECGIDYERSGYDLVMPSPFKEQAKRRIDPGYIDSAKRLSVTIVEKNGQPIILWQCWYTKRPDGTPFGGMSAYALERRLGMPQRTILERLGMRFNEEVAAQDEAEDKARVILNQTIRGHEDDRRRLQASSWVLNPTAEMIKPKTAAVAAPALRMREVPSNAIPLFSGLTQRGDDIVLKRAITAEVARAYGLMWDIDMDAILMPWRDSSGAHVTHVWYNPEWPRKAYRFPPREAGLASKENTIFGIDQWRPGMPLTLSEGTYDALSLRGCALGGSSLTEPQKAILVSLSPAPELVILALDKDGAGVSGAMSIAKTLRIEMPKTRFATVFPPAKDWNQIAQDGGADAALKIFVQRVRDSDRGRSLVSTVRQIAIHR